MLHLLKGVGLDGSLGQRSFPEILDSSVKLLIFTRQIVIILVGYEVGCVVGQIDGFVEGLLFG